MSGDPPGALAAGTERPDDNAAGVLGPLFFLFLKKLMGILNPLNTVFNTQNTSLTKLTGFLSHRIPINKDPNPTIKVPNPCNRSQKFLLLSNIVKRPSRVFATLSVKNFIKNVNTLLNPVIYLQLSQYFWIRIHCNTALPMNNRNSDPPNFANPSKNPIVAFFDAFVDSVP